MIRLALLGDPVEHSRSPAIHAAALAHAGITGAYEARCTDADGVVMAVEEIRRGDLVGANVTMPLKAIALAACDRAAPSAMRAGAVNTLYLTGDGVSGENTDIGGITDACRSAGIPTDAPVLVLGAGGAAGGAVVAFEGRDLIVSARTREAARSLLERTGVAGSVATWGDPVPGAVVVNATPLGMAGEALPERVADRAAGLVDLAYGGGVTPAIAAAQGRIPCADGIDVLVAQAARSFELWTGIRPDRGVMEAAARP